MPAIPGEPAVGPPGHEPAASVAAWTEVYPMFGKAMDALGWLALRYVPEEMKTVVVAAINK